MLNNEEIKTTFVEILQSLDTGIKDVEVKLEKKLILVNYLEKSKYLLH